MLWVCVCSLRYPACHAHAPYCHEWPAPLYNIFPHHLINGTIFEGERSYWTQNVCSDFLYNFCLKHCSLQDEMSKIWHKMYIGLHVKYPLFLSNFNETCIFSTDFRKKSSNIKFHENPSSGCRVVPCGRADGHDEANSHFSQVCERAFKKRERKKIVPFKKNGEILVRGRINRHVKPKKSLIQWLKCSECILHRTLFPVIRSGMFRSGANKFSTNMGTTSTFLVTEGRVHTEHVSNTGPQNTPRQNTKFSIPSNMARGFCARLG